MESKTNKKNFNNLCQENGYKEFIVGDEKWEGDGYPEGHFAFFSPNTFTAEGEYIAMPFSRPDTYPASDCKIKLIPKNDDEKIFVKEATIEINKDDGQVLTDIVTDMTSCGDNYFSINGKRLCGDDDFYSSGYENFFNVELGGAGEPLELHLYNTQPVEGKVRMYFYTSAQKIESSVTGSSNKNDKLVNRS
ncbi:Oidioi.mRNA.OKI2018_I69.chr1.g3712.t1.cds [Oikopleura dioica]|uniref:Oidioi.mRNA.OKI2018_I69.chr1.g3712.t1.cds n=1 Tax=Oikopleura dioica TaxID=34765 RepID=A0ABN7SV25_OIKDI|nr:Oidioi.mRNA.OKI2018_I69.chr1.g3712.t1.cds [Oikopleura dioica]